MKNKDSLIDLGVIVVIYAIYWILIWLAVEYDLPGGLGIAGTAEYADGDKFRAAFNLWAQVVMGVSGLLALAWYAVGEWGLRGHTTTPQTWLLIWFLMQVVVIVVSFLAFFLGPQASENALILDLFYVGSGTLFLYIASVFRSPTATKYLLWPARHVRS